MKTNPLRFIPEDQRDQKLNIITDAMNEEIANRKLKDPEERHYLLLYYAVDPDDHNKEEIKSFDIIKGRTEIYKYVKNMIEYLDIHRSKLLVDTVPLKDAVSVYEFMKAISKYYPDDDFDIEKYNNGEDMDEEE